VILEEKEIANPTKNRRDDRVQNEQLIRVIIGTVLIQNIILI
jgi:hypothetical protein